MSFGYGLSLKVSPPARRGSMNMLVCGSFENTTGWVISLGAGTFTAVGGVGRITNASAMATIVAQGFATVIGRAYRVTGRLVGTTGTVSFYLCRKADDANPATNIVSLKSGAGAFDANFTATATTSYITLQLNSDTAGTADFDDLIVRPA